MNTEIQETIRIEVSRMCNLLHLNSDYIREMCELTYFIRNCMVLYTKHRDPYKLIPTVLFVWLRYQNYLITWEEVGEYSSLSYEEFKRSLLDFYEHFPFEVIREAVVKIHMEYISRVYEMVNKIKQLS